MISPSAIETAEKTAPGAWRRRAQEAAPRGSRGLARLGLWAKISEEVRRHRLHIVAPPGIEAPGGMFLARLADREGRPVFRDGEFELKRGSAVGDYDR